MIMLFESNSNVEATLNSESNGQMLLFVAFVVLISIRSLFAEIGEALLSVVSLFLSLLPSATAKPSPAKLRSKISD